MRGWPSCGGTEAKPGQGGIWTPGWAAEERIESSESMQTERMEDWDCEENPCFKHRQSPSVFFKVENV